MKRSAALAALAAPLIPRVVAAQPHGSPRKIGLTAPLTGPFAAISVEYVAAYELSVAHQNGRGGIAGRPVQLIVEDSAATAEGGIAAMRKLVQVNAVEGVLTFLTNVVTAQNPLAAQLEIPVLAVIETTGPVDNATWVFANGVRTALAEPLFVRYWRDHGMKRLYAFLSNNAVGLNQRPVLLRRAAEAGADIEIAFINLTDTDYSGELARAKSYDPDGLYINTSGLAADAIVIRQSRGLGMNQQWFNPANFFTVHTWREALGPYVEGMIFGGARVDPIAGRRFIRDYRAKLGFEPGYASGELYDAGSMLMEAMAHASTPKVLRSAIATIKGVPSVLGGKLAMGPDHYSIIPREAIGLWQVRRGVEYKIASLA